MNFTSTQAPLGQALYRHYQADADESYLLIVNGRAFSASRGYLELCAIMDGPWPPLPLVRRSRKGGARRLRVDSPNRYRWFGHTEYRARLTPEQRTRLL